MVLQGPGPEETDLPEDGLLRSPGRSQRTSTSSVCVCVCVCVCVRVYACVKETRKQGGTEGGSWIDTHTL